MFLGADGPVRKLIDPFVSESIALEKISDVIPRGLIVGGRGGETKTGSKVYSPTDDGPTKFMKSFGHIIKGVRPTAIDTGEKIIKGLEQDVKRGGQPVTLEDELLALFSGIRIINVDVPRTMQYKITDYNKKIKSVTTAEKFFSLQDYQRRGPLVIADEFRNIQEETFRTNQDFYFILQDAIRVGLPEKELKKLMRRRGMSVKNVKKLLRGQNIPYTAYKERMKKRIKEAEQIGKEQGQGKINKDYFYPRRLLRQIEKEYKKKELNTAPKEIEPVSQLPVQDTTTTASLPAPEIKTPPLPNTPQPKVRTAQQINPQTNLTRTETALLSPEEQVIASRT